MLMFTKQFDAVSSVRKIMGQKKSTPHLAIHYITEMSKQKQ